MLSLTKFSYIKEILSRSLKDGDDPNPWSRPACGCSVETRNVTGEGRRREKRNKAYEGGCFVQHPAARTLFWTSLEEPPYTCASESHALPFSSSYTASFELLLPLPARPPLLWLLPVVVGTK